MSTYVPQSPILPTPITPSHVPCWMLEWQKTGGNKPPDGMRRAIAEWPSGRH